MIEVAFGALAAALAMHGFGRVVGALVGDDDAPPALVLAWGLAVYLALAGWLTAAGAFTAGAQIAVVAAGALLGPVWAIRRRHAGAAASTMWRAPRLTADNVLLALAAVVLWIQIASAAGARHDAFVDADGYLLGPLARLAQTGDAGEAPGALRGGGAGGALGVASLGWVFGDPRAAHAVDGGLALALALALALHLRRPGAAHPYVGFALIAFVLAVPSLPLDLEPRWTIVALVLGAYATWRRAAAGPPRLFAAVVLLAAAAACVRHGGFAVAAVALAAAPPRHRVPALAIAAAVLAPYLVLLLQSGATIPFSPPRLAAGAAAAAVLWALLSALLRHLADRPLDRMLVALAAALALTAALAPSPRTAALLALPWLLAIALLFLVAALRPLADSPPRLTPAALLALAGLAFLFGGVRVKLGAPPMQWGDRLAARIDPVRELGARDRFGDTRERAAYAAALREIPRGARVGIWIERGDLIDHASHDVVDLRVPPPRRALAAGGLDFLVLSPSTELRPGSPIARLAAAGRALPTDGDLTVIDLRR